MATVDVKQRGGKPVVNLIMPGAVVLGDSKIDFHASFDGNQKIWGSGKDIETAVGDCLRTASSSLELTGYELPSEHSGKSCRELGKLAWSGGLPNVSPQRID